MSNNYNDFEDFAASLELKQKIFIEDLIEELSEKYYYFLEEYKKNNDTYCFLLMYEFLIETRLLYCLLKRHADEKYKKMYLEYSNIEKNFLKEKEI